MYGRWPSSSTASTLAVQNCATLLVAAASLAKRLRSSAPEPGCSTLMATRSPSGP